MPIRSCPSNPNAPSTDAAKGPASVERVLLMAPEPFYEDRGTPIAVRQVLEALSERGALVDLLTYPMGEQIELPGLRTFRVPNPLGIRKVPIGFSLRKLWFGAFLVAALRRRLRETRYSYIHAVEESAFVAARFGKRAKIPVIYDMQSSLPDQMALLPAFRGSAVQKVLKACERWLIRNVDFVVCSAGLEDHVRRIDGERSVREWRYPAYEETTCPEDVILLREELKIAPATRVVLYCGTFERYQGLPILIHSIPKVRDRIPDTVFVLVGSTGALDPSIEQPLSKLRAEGAVRLVSRQPRDAIPKFLAMADVAVSPRSDGENLPLKIFDYLGAAKPIVATDTPSHRKALDDDRALLVDPTPEAFADGIVELLRGPERSRGLSAGAKAYAEANLGWSAFSDAVASLHGRAVVTTKHR